MKKLLLMCVCLAVAGSGAVAEEYKYGPFNNYEGLEERRVGVTIPMTGEVGFWDPIGGKEYTISSKGGGTYWIKYAVPIFAATYYGFETEAGAAFDPNTDSVTLTDIIAKNTDPGIKFLPSTSENVMSHGPYDIIFALSVLCRWPETQFVRDSSRLYPFRKFDDTATLLDAPLSVGGLMVILNANYHFSDASVSGRYQGVTGLNLSQYECVHAFSKDNKKISEDGTGEWIFKKVAMGCLS